MLFFFEGREAYFFVDPTNVLSGDYLHGLVWHIIITYLLGVVAMTWVDPSINQPVQDPQMTDGQGYRTELPDR